MELATSAEDLASFSADVPARCRRTPVVGDVISREGQEQLETDHNPGQTPAFIARVGFSKNAGLRPQSEFTEMFLKAASPKQGLSRILPPQLTEFAATGCRTQLGPQTELWRLQNLQAGTCAGRKLQKTRYCWLEAMPSPTPAESFKRLRRHIARRFWIACPAGICSSSFKSFAILSGSPSNTS